MTAGSPILAFLPEQQNCYTYGKTNVDPFALNESLKQVAGPIARPALVTAGEGVTVCRSSTSGNFWTCYDNPDADNSFLVEFNATSGAVVRKARTLSPLFFADWTPEGVPQMRIAELEGAHALFDLGCDRVLTVNRWTGVVVRLLLQRGATSTDFWKAKVDKLYKLMIAPLDAWPNADGTRLLYIDGDHVRIWDLEKDRFFRTVL